MAKSVCRYNRKIACIVRLVILKTFTKILNGHHHRVATGLIIGICNLHSNNCKLSRTSDIEYPGSYLVLCLIPADPESLRVRDDIIKQVIWIALRAISGVLLDLTSRKGESSSRIILRPSGTLMRIAASLMLCICSLQ